MYMQTHVYIHTIYIYIYAGKTRRGHEENEAKLFCWDSFYFRISNTVIILFEKITSVKRGFS